MTPYEKRTENIADYMLKKLEARHFEAYFCKTSQEALEKASSLIPDGSTVAWGGSATIRDIGLTRHLHERNVNVIDRDLGKNPEEVAELHRKGLLSDYFLASSNAITTDGILVNIDGNGNRTAAMCFGPKNVIIICGMNKVASDLDSAISRARNHAAPINVLRFPGNTPCAKSGKCHNCTSIDCICSQVLITRVSRPANRTKVILVAEDLGY